MARKPQKTDRLSRELARTAIDLGQFFVKSKWTSIRVVAVVMEDEAEAAPGFIVAERHEYLGQACLLQGERSLAIHNALVTRRLDEMNPLALQMQMMLGGTETLGRLNHTMQWLHQESGGSGRRESQVPFVIATDPEFALRRPRKPELRRFLAAFRAFLAAMATNELQPTAATHLERTPTLIVGGDPYAPTWRLEYRSFTLPELAEVEEWNYPSPELTQWKRVNDSVKRIIARFATDLGCMDREPLDFFFTEDGEGLLEGPEGDIALPAYIEWFARDWGDVNDSPSILETVLDEYPLQPDERSLIESRRDRIASIYVIDAILDDDTVYVKDRYSSERAEVKDSFLAQATRAGYMAPLRLIDAGPFVFCILLGPPLPAMLFLHGLGRIEEFCGDTVPVCFDTEPHAFGLLFNALDDEFDEDDDSRPRLNFDGHLLVVQTARVEVLDEARLRQGLDAHPQLERIEDEEAWAWYQELVPGVERRLRGHMWLNGKGTLFIEVNSDERRIEAQRWLQAIGGIGAAEIEIHDSDDYVEDESEFLLGPEEEAELIADPEFQELFRRNLDEKMMGWLDEQVPDLDMQTPREVATTPEGRARVKALLHRMGNPSPLIPYDVPLAAMYRELGIE